MSKLKKEEKQYARRNGTVRNRFIWGDDRH